MKVKENGTIDLSESQRKVIKARIAAAESWAEKRAKLGNEDDEGGNFSTESERNLALIAGKYWERRGKRSQRQINHVFPALQVKHQLITGGETIFLLTARRAEFLGLEEVAEPTLNDAWDSLGFDEACDAAFWDSLIYKEGGVLELGWKYEEREVDPQAGAISEMPMMVGGEMASPYPEEDQGLSLPGQEYADEDQALEAASTPEMQVVSDDPFVERFNPEDFFVDPNCTTFKLTDARHVFRHKTEYLDRVKANGRYVNTAKLKGTATSYWKNTDDLDKPRNAAVEADVMEVDLYDGYVLLDVDKDGEEELLHVVFAAEQDEELLAEPCPYSHFHKPGFYSPFPFEVMPAAVVDNDCLDGVPDASTLRDMQVSHDESYTQVEYQRSHSPNLLAVTDDMVEGDDGEAFKRRIEAGIENTVVPMSPEALGKAGWLQRAAIHEDSYKALAETPAKMRDRVGVSEFQSNMLPNKQMTATEAAQLSSQGGTRQDSEIQAYMFFLSRVGYKVLTLLQQMTTQREYPLPKPAQGEPPFGTATPDKLLGLKAGRLNEPGIQFKLDLDAARKLPKNEYIERSQDMELLKTLVPFAEMPDPRLPNRPMVNMPALLRSLVEKYHIANQDEIVPPDPTSEEIQAFQSEQEAAQQAQARQAEEQMMMQGKREEMQMRDRQADRDQKGALEMMKMAAGGGPGGNGGSI